MLLVFLLVLPLSPLAMARWRPGSIGCQQAKAENRGLVVRCVDQRLTQVPVGLSNRTTRLNLSRNQLRSLIASSFSDLVQLEDLDLSKNQLVSLETGCFSPMASSLRYLDLSTNQLTTLDPAVFTGLRVRVNLTQNPWHCDCSMQMAVPRLDLDRSSLEKVLCETSDLLNLGATGLPLVTLLEDWDLCESVRRTTDVVTLVTMFFWFVMLIFYLVYYVRHNQVVARRHFDYLKFLQSRDPFRPGVPG